MNPVAGQEQQDLVRQPGEKKREEEFAGRPEQWRRHAFSALAAMRPPRAPAA